MTSLRQWLGSFRVALCALAVAALGGPLLRHSRGWRGSARVRTAAEYASLASGIEVLSAQAPLAVLLEGAISASESEHIMRRALPHLQPAFVGAEADGSDGRRGRSNTAAWLNHDESAEVWGIVQRVAALVGIPATHAEQMQIIHYERGQECACAAARDLLHSCTRHSSADARAYRLDTAHWDGFPASVLRTMPTGQRLVTALGYLTSVTDGGETRLASGMVVPAVQGRLLIFHNTAHGTTSLDQASRHAGQLVRSGEKWAFNLWFKEYLRENISNILCCHIQLVPWYRIFVG